MITEPPTITLAGRRYPLVLGNLAKFRFASIAAAHRKLEGPSFLTQLVWAAYSGGLAHPYHTWEHLAPVVAELTPEAYAELDDAMSAALPPPVAEPVATEKTDTPEPTPAEKKSDLTESGHSPAVG